MKFSPEVSEENESFDTNIIPLIDVLLVLLIFFMASSSFVSSGGFNVSLPKAQTKLADAPVEPLTVTLTASGQIALGSSILSRDQLREEFAAAAKRDPKPTLIVRADERVEHGAVVKVLDEAKASGLDQIAISAIVEK